MQHTMKLAVAGLLTIGALGASTTAAVAAPKGEPCARQVAQVTKAEDALARVTAVFERQQTKVKKAKKAAQQADTPAEENAAEEALEDAVDGRDKVKKAKKAQLQRLAKAQQRLDKCLAAQPTV